jgi:hypothetical protein
MGDSPKGYPLELRARLVELARAGATPAELARRHAPSARTIRRWVAEARDLPLQPVGLSDVSEGAYQRPEVSDSAEGGYRVRFEASGRIPGAGTPSLRRTDPARMVDPARIAREASRIPGPPLTRIVREAEPEEKKEEDDGSG